MKHCGHGWKDRGNCFRCMGVTQPAPTPTVPPGEGTSEPACTRNGGHEFPDDGCLHCGWPRSDSTVQQCDVAAAPVKHEGVPTSEQLVDAMQKAWHDWQKTRERSYSASIAEAFEAGYRLSARSAEQALVEARSIADGLLRAMRNIVDMADRDGNLIEMHRDELRAIAKTAIRLAARSAGAIPTGRSSAPQGETCAVSEFVAKQKPLDPESSSIIADNRDALYDRGNTSD